MNIRYYASESNKHNFREVVMATKEEQYMAIARSEQYKTPCICNQYKGLGECGYYNCKCLDKISPDCKRFMKR